MITQNASCKSVPDVSSATVSDSECLLLVSSVPGKAGSCELAPSDVFTGELINLAMFCERMRRRFWPEWFVEVEDLYYDGDTESSSGGGSPTGLLDFGLFSRTDTLEESDGSSHSADGHANTHSPDSDHSLFDSDVGTGSDNDIQLKEDLMPDLEV